MPLYKSYSQQDLDDQYNVRKAVPNFQFFLDLWHDSSVESLTRLNGYKDLSYGSHERECLDIYPALNSNAPTVIFIHGGYWKQLHKNEFQFIAEWLGNLNFNVVMITYPLTPEVRIPRIIDSCRKAIVWLFENSDKYSLNIDQIIIAGHSAGGHLASKMLTTNWSEFIALPNANPFIGGVLISGLYNLEPIRLCYLNDEIGLISDEINQANVIDDAPPEVPVTILVGADETDEFVDQSKLLYTKWSEKNARLFYKELPGIHHFNIITEMTVDNSETNLLFQEFVQTCINANPISGS